MKRDDVQHVEQLALVLVDALDLHVEQRIGAHLDAEVGADLGGEALLVVLLDGAELAAEGGILGEGGEARDLAEVGHPALADARGDQRRQRLVDVVQPPPRRHTVGHVDEFSRIEVGEIGEYR